MLLKTIHEHQSLFNIDFGTMFGTINSGIVGKQPLTRTFLLVHLQEKLLVRSLNDIIIGNLHETIEHGLIVRPNEKLLKASLFLQHAP